MQRFRKRKCQKGYTESNSTQGDTKTQTTSTPDDPGTKSAKFQSSAESTTRAPAAMGTPCTILAPIWGRKGQGEGLGLQLRQRWKKRWTRSKLERWQRPISVLEWWKGFSQPKLVWGERVSKSVLREFQGKFSKRGKRWWILWQRGEGVRAESSQVTHPCPEFQLGGPGPFSAQGGRGSRRHQDPPEPK